MSERKLIKSEDEARAYVAGRADEEAIARLEAFSKLLLAENQRQNLISKPSEASLWQRHVADSVQLLDHVPRETIEAATGDPWMDLGTGAGFPGIVLAILMPHTRFALVEARGRRVEFLEKAASEIGLEQCKVIGERLERIKPFPTRVITARAFAPLTKLLRLSAPFSTNSTRYVLPKGRSAAQELRESSKSIQEMFHVKHSLTDGEAGIIVSK